MATPPPDQIQRDGQTYYYNPYSGTYTASRSYGQRMQRGFRLGRTRQQSRRAATPQAAINRLGVTEATYRRQQIQAREAREEAERQRYFFEAQQFRSTYGFELDQWNIWRINYIDWINEHRVAGSNIDTIKPSHISDIIQLYNMGAVDLETYPTWQDWVEYRLSELRTDIEDYYRGNVTPGQVNFFTRPSYTPIEFWWYH